MNRKGIASALALGLIAVTAAGCDLGESGHDAGVAGRDDTSRHVYNMIDGTPNITAFCSFGNLIYVSSRNNGGGFLTAIAKAPQCEGVKDGGEPHA